MRTLVVLIMLSLFSSIVLSQSTELKYNLEKGKTYRVKSTMVQDQTVTVQGTESKTETKNASCFSLKMLDAKPEFFLAETKFDTIRTEVSMPPMVFTSTEKGDINSEDMIAVTNCILNRLSNSTMVVKFDYSGHVMDIMNFSVIRQTVMQGTDSLKGQAAMAKGQLEMLVKKESLIGMIEGFTAYLPGKEVKKGDKWETDLISYTGGVGMAINSSFLLTDLSKSTAILESDVIVEPASTDPIVMNGAEITSELRGLGKSHMEIDPKTGWVKNGTSKLQLAGNLNVNAGGQHMTMPVESQINSKTIVIE
jgi:hypothetical protein